MDVGVGPAVLVLLRSRMAGVYQPPPCNRIIIIVAVVDCPVVLFVLGPTGRPSVGRCKVVVPCSALVGVLCDGVGAAWGGGRPWLGWAGRRAALRVRQAGLVFLPWAIEQP